MDSPQFIRCRGCGKLKPVSDKELDAEWKLSKENGNPNITREEALNDICFCSDCAGLNDDTTLHTKVAKAR